MTSEKIHLSQQDTKPEEIISSARQLLYHLHKEYYFK